MFCAQCGTQNEPDSNFCKKCGSPLHQNQLNPPAGEAPKKRGCCSCSGLMLGCSLIFFAALIFLGYAIYSGPEFLNKFLAPSDEIQKEISSFAVTNEDANQLQKNIDEFKKYIQKGGTIEVHLKEIELNSHISKTLPALKDPKNEMKVEDLKIKLSESGIKVMGIVKVLKLRSYFAAAFKVSVNANNTFDYTLNELTLGKLGIPSIFFNMMLGFAQRYVNFSRSSNEVNYNGIKFNILKITYLDSKIVIECFKPVQQ